MFRRFGAISVVALVCLGSMAYAASLDRVVAVINDDVITQLELESRLKGLAAEIKSRGAEPPPESVLRKQMLQRMINDRLQLQAAGRMGLKVSEQELNDAISSVARSNKLTQSQLRDALKEQGLSYALFLEGVRTQLMINKIFTRHIRGGVVVTDEELNDFIARGGGKADAREYDISHILIRLPESADSDAVDKTLKKVREIQTRLEQGLDFSEAATIYSDAPDATEGGRLGWREPRQLPELFTEALSRIDVGRASRVLRSPNGFHILYINDARGVNSTSVPQTRVRHILIKTDEFLSEAEASHRLEQIRERVLNGDDFAELARVHSDDPVSAIKGGDLGWVMPGEVTGAFEDEMSRLSIDQISHPVKSPFGLHIIQVRERREQNMGEEVTRARARAQLIAQKSDERYDTWLRRLRDESFVNILDEELKL